MQTKDGLLYPADSVIIPDVDSLIDSVAHTLESIFTGSPVFSVTSGSFLSHVDPLSAGVIPSEPLWCWRNAAAWTALARSLP